MQTAGFVLTGGRSRRMGRDKALLPLGSHTMVQEIAGKVGLAAGSCTLIGEPKRYRGLGLECLPDLRPGFGPLAGIETALAAGRAELNLIVACDMPGLRLVWLDRLISAAHRTNRFAVVARDELGKIHPSCGVYKSGALGAVQAALDGGRLKLMDLAAELEAENVQLPGIIHNLNTSSEWEEWQHASD